MLYLVHNEIIAILTAWEFPLFRFVEHIAADPAIRGTGVGRKLMTSYIEESVQPILLEVELSITELAQRRVSFYERLGFHIISNMCSLRFRTGSLVYRSR
ncbi:GNAT family N-acetyltransferase [Paenibacillus dendritiformis]|uniref:N-acetyltransferase domain-containing protein n=1 Tax=Paenibacillus dendritiformis C454 TaxID=1131935 RepID=H3SDI2_9BACL|nr:GNAT family N-acetyltransferase [Paenibacillus dendritiformis]EHQ62843.1 hypothetical protein PDENDC454_08085 [Paenibacillus dendritiformis C454]CAH8770784.1 GNAT family N-acetyltransferase [Paenibacillus dendritiformis]